MTDAAFYQRMDALATKLLSKFGSPATIRRTPKADNGKPNAEGKVVKQPPQDFPGLAVKTQSEVVREQLQAEFAYMHIIKTPTVPVPDDLLIHAGETVKVKKVKTINPAGQGLIISFVGSEKP